MCFSRKNVKRSILIIVLLGTALFLRLYSLWNTTEFLGDQGRDGLAVLTAIEQKSFLVVGPTVGAGYFTGPAYYYLIAPLYLLFPNAPLAPIIEMCVFAVAAIALFLYVATQYFGFEIAYIVSVLWMCSPVMIIQDRRLWNPTTIPFFVLLLVVSMMVVLRQKKYWGYVTAAMAAAILMQLHYVNAITIAFIFGVWFILSVVQEKQHITKTQGIWIALAIVIGALIVSPFVVYEIQHNFMDVKGSIGTLAYGEERLFSKRAYVRAIGDIAELLWKTSVALKNQIILLIVAAAIVCINVLKRNKAQFLVVVGFCFGVCALAFYKDTIQPQYTYQLIPFVFFLIAGFLSSLPNKIKIAMSILLVILASYLSWVNVHPYEIREPDVPRVTKISTAVVQLTNGEPFSFTVINSRSFNDLHFRYFFHLYRIHPLPFDDPSYKTLLVVCENECPGELGSKISVMCFGEVCPLDKPSIDLTTWSYEGIERVGTSAIYIYSR